MPNIAAINRTEVKTIRDRLENFVCSEGGNLHTTIHVINCFSENTAEKLEKRHLIFHHMPCKKALDYSEKSLDQPKNH